jgi:hypothetical protein
MAAAAAGCIRIWIRRLSGWSKLPIYYFTDAATTTRSAYDNPPITNHNPIGVSAIGAVAGVAV